MRLRYELGMPHSEKDVRLKRISDIYIVKLTFFLKRLLDHYLVKRGRQGILTFFL